GAGSSFSQKDALALSLHAFAPSPPLPLRRRQLPLLPGNRPYGRCLSRRRPSTGWPRAGSAPAASLRASSPLRVGRWQRVVLLPAGGLPADATPAVARPLAGCYPCGWLPLAGGLATAGRARGRLLPLWAATPAGGRPLQVTWP
ncbi:hypothetical protein BHE74_00053822, partial [Ensete ventricosum]